MVHVSRGAGEVSRLQALLARAVRRALLDPKRQVKFRAFRGSTLDYRLHKDLQDRPPDRDRDIPSWVAAQAGADCCVAINDLAAWELELSEWFIARVADIREEGNLDLTAKQDTYAFVSGGGGWTPFGIHQDFEPSFIFHLGPSPKTVWVWESPERPVGVVDSAPAFAGVSFRIAESLPSAREIVLKPGDFLNVPAFVYHVFRNEGPSAFVGLAVHLPGPRGRSGDNGASELSQAKLATAGFVQRPARAALAAHRSGSDRFRLAHPDAVRAWGESALCVRGRVLRLTSSRISAAALCQELQSDRNICAESLAQRMGVARSAAARIVAALNEVGGLTPA